MQTLVNFIVNDLSKDPTFASAFDEETLNGLKMSQKIIEGTVSGKSYSSEELATLLGMKASDLKQMYALYTSKQGDTSAWKISFKEFINFIEKDIVTNKSYADAFDKDALSSIGTIQKIINGVENNTKYSVDELQGLMNFGDSMSIDKNQLELMYIYYFSTINSDPKWTMTIYDFFNFMVNDVVNDERFSQFFNEDTRASLLDSKDELDKGVEQLRGENYSRLILDTTFPEESEETTTFMDKLVGESNSNIEGNYYFVGNTPMAYEMSQSFDRELNFITLLTAVAIFIVVAITFRSFIIPLILVLIIQAGVYATISIIGLQNYSIFYLALLIVQCILMGATIDYGILYTNYYRENRSKMELKEALKAAYDGSLHTILTSGLIMIVVTGILGYAFANPTVGQICQTISKGALIATILIVFVLPGILATFDKLIIKKIRGSKEAKDVA